MKISLSLSTSALAAVLCGGWLLAAAFTTNAADAPKADAMRQQARTAYQNGNFKDAYEAFRQLALDPQTDARLVGDDLQMAAQCLPRLNRLNALDAFREAVVAAHPNQWRVLWSAAENSMNMPHDGFIIAGQFERGPHRGGGEWANAYERDRVRALQWMTEALPLAQQDDDHAAVGDFLLSMSEMLVGARGWNESWRLQYLTDLKTLPDYDRTGWGGRWGRNGGQTQGAPVGEDGQPIYYHVPKSFAAAANDGERWRWCLEQVVEFNPARRDAMRLQFADFLRTQFGTETLAQWGWFRSGTNNDEGAETGAWALHTLNADETIARLATGIRRFTLPEEFDFIRVYQKVAEEAPDAKQGGYGEAAQALERLGEIFENRRQFPKAAGYWRQLVENFGNASSDKRQAWRQRLDQIVKNWGTFEPVSTQPAGSGATVEFRFRNGHAVNFTAQEIKVERLLEDVKNYLKTSPRELNWGRIQIENLGYRLVQEAEAQYLGKKVAEWSLELEPRPDHFDKRITVATPLTKPGAYLVTATMEDGNVTTIILWVADTAIVHKPLDGQNLYYIADAVSGKPIAKANVEFFGYQQVWQERRARSEIFTKQFAEYADAEGQVLTDAARQPQDHNWLITARTPEGRFAYLGFNSIWYGQRYDEVYNAVKVFAITDRPVYRPAQQVHFKFWVAHAQYDMEDASQFAGQTFTVEIMNPRGEKLLEKPMKADAYGGIEGDLPLPADAQLGVYQLSIAGHGGGSFRVEEYKKPEFEVTVDAPKEPVMLGETITAEIKAKYYFGSPVTQAKVKYKVLRTAHEAGWFPPGPWDWFYGPGYWWFAYDYDWYPGWRMWGCVRPAPWWWPRSGGPPEVVAEREVEIGPDGTVKVAIDTSLAKAIHGDQDQRYQITAEVVDASRRTIVGQGEVLVASQPFKVYAWVNRGFFRVGETIEASFSARTLDGKPVTGNGALKLLQISYRDGKPVETPVQEWSLATNEAGRAEQKITASAAGQYRLSYTVTDAQGHAIEGGYVFTIMGEGFDGAQFRFNAVEIVPDKKDYSPGEKVYLQINTDRAGATVLLFARASNGVYLKPTVLKLDGKSTLYELDVSKRDMPNFFVEALTVHGGRVHTATREICVPPEKRVLNVAVAPSAESYKPGEKAKVKITLTDMEGHAFVGSTVVAIYDKAVEYISGGSNVPDIRAFFWKWRRSHNESGENNLERSSQNVVPPGVVAMQELGIFGGGVEEMQDSGRAAGGLGGAVYADGMVRGRAMGLAMKAARADGPMAMSAPAAAPMRAMEDESAGLQGQVGGRDKDAANEADGGASGQQAALVEPTIRKNFADTALWVGQLTTDGNGTAEVALDMPENLTTWRIKTWALGHGTKVGEGMTDVVTRKDLILRMETPRFFVQTDEVVLSAIVHNYLKGKKSVQLALELGSAAAAKNAAAAGDPAHPGTEQPAVLELLDAAQRQAEVAPNGETRVDWRVRVLDEGKAVVRMKALTDEDSDAMELEIPSYIHGMLKTESFSGALRPEEESGKIHFTIPKDRRPEQTQLVVRYSPSLAAAMVDALPYLVDYPYGCTEQTLNRFLPTVITQKVLIELGVDLERLKNAHANLNAQELGDPAERAQRWQRFDRNPVFDKDEVTRMVKDGVERLTAMQLSDGGWGWFSGWGERSSPHTTAVVVRGLLVAKENDVAIVPGVLERGIEWLKRYQAEQRTLLERADAKPKDKPWKDSADNLDAFVYMVLVEAGVRDAKMGDFLFRDRTRLSTYCLAMLGVAFEEQQDRPGMREKLDMLLQNLRQYVVRDDENQTAWLNLPGGFWWCWFGSEFEAQAYYLKLLARTDPKGDLAPRLVKYLLNNRKHATYWNSTRDTALCIEAMAEFLRKSGEMKPEMTVEIRYDGEIKKAVEITPTNLFQFDATFTLAGDEVTAGPHEVQLVKRGRGPLYYNAYVTNFTLEDFIKKAGLEVKVERKYYKLERVKKTEKVAGARGQAVDQEVEKYERRPIENLATLKSGDLCEIELIAESKNDYEYIVFEDMKPAGFEPVDVRSGYTGNALGAYVEFRDNRVAMFVRALARGRHSVSYQMRAEIPGKFSALPTRAWAMYAPELKANSDEIKLRVEDQE